ncbi:MAG: hypothetical protein CMK49_00325 [Prochlorococcus sp. SP3034]|nr:hypothetical protein [Prochlorococcus sp. SP3034]|tara:strand:+ start:6960 stop:8318 length:1359 start_codon:yes stop_codon:yes gene_type:complete
MKIIVFDDDPTGSQTVHDCLLLLRWDYKTLLRGLRSSSKLLFILCDTRALSEADASKRLREICIALTEVINNEGYLMEDFVFISRGDSTLRGHNFLEPYIINQKLGPFDATFHIPAFIEGNRVTKNGRHYVNNMPAHKTIFAKDKIFGYQTNILKNLLYEKNTSKLQIHDIENFNLSDLEVLSINEENEAYIKIKNLKNNQQIIVDALNYSHLDRFCLVINKLKSKKKFLFRTAASFISAFSKIGDNPKNDIYYSHLRRKNNHNKYMRGLVVFGSYVELSSIQLINLLQISSCKPIEIKVNHFYQIDKDKESQIQLLKKQLVNQIRECIKKEFTPVLFTSRKVISFKSQDQEFAFNRSLSLFIAQIINELKFEIGYLISKGGITSNTILSEGFKVDYAYLEGQIMTGISLLSVNLTKINKCIPVVTFPGNLGDKHTMQKIWRILENKKTNNL